MNRLRDFILVSGILVSFGLVTINPTQGSLLNLPGPPVTDRPGTVMPGWPVPDKPIPHHEPGQPSRRGDATHEVTQLNALGEQETVELTGLDALLADGTMTDPLQGNYRLVGLDKLIFSSYAYGGSNSFSVQSFEYVSPTLGLIPNSTVDYGNFRFNAIAAGDLNGDAADEQIAAWVNPIDNHIYMNIGELPGSFGKTTSSPAVVAHSDGGLDVMVRGYDDALWHKHYDGATWGAWAHAPGGLLLSNPVAASRATGELDVFALGLDNQVYHTQWISPTWSAMTVVNCGDDFPEIELRVPLPSIPTLAAASRSGDQLDLFRLGPDNSLYWCQFNDGVGWGSWQSLGGMLLSGPGAVTPGDGSVQVYALGIDGAVWYTSSRDWDDWQRLETPAGIARDAFPVLTSAATGQVTVYLAGTENRVWSARHDGSTWDPWSSITVDGGDLGAGIDAAMGPSGTLLFAQMADGSLQYRLNASSWTGLDGLDVSGTFDTNQVTMPLPADDELENRVIDLTTGFFSGDGRQQVVLAYDGADGDLRLEIYDMQDGFRLTKTAELTTTISSAGWPRVAAGDVDGDGVDEIGFVYVPDSPPAFHGLVLRVYEIDKDSNGRWTGDISEISYSQVKIDDEGDIWTSWQFAGTLRIAAGDIVPEQNPISHSDEFAVVTDWRHDIFGVSRRLSAYVHLYDHQATPKLTEELKHDPVIDANDGVAPGWNRLYANGAGLAVGDLDGALDAQGRVYDEIVITWPYDFAGEDYPYLRRDLQIYQYNPNTTNFDLRDHWYINSEEWSQYTFLDTLVVGDLDQDLKDEIVLASHYDTGVPTGPYYLDVFEFDTLSSGPVFQYLLGFSAVPRAFNLAVGDFTGESIRVGPPSYRVQQAMTSPVVFLNLPPMHRDIIEVDQATQVIEVNNGASATHRVETGQTDIYSSESKREWELSTGFDMSVGGGGTTVKTSMDNTYGENFSTSTTAINEITIADQTVADLYDQVIYNATDYAVWEYPVYGLEDGDPDDPQTIAVVWPLVDATSQPSVTKGDWCNEGFYAPGHQQYNVWSYDHTDLGWAGFKDKGEYGEILNKQTTGGTTTEFRLSENNAVSRSASFHNQISAGLEYSYESELNIPLIGNVWDFSFRAYANGSYGHENISTFSSEFSEESGVDVDIPSEPYLPNIKAYLYWGKAEYLVLDYQTEPNAGAYPWSFYNKPDPAFILPWYGFPAPINEPSPCPGKELFTHDITLEPAFAQNGDTLTITATVRNFSPIATDDVRVRFYLGYPAPGNDQIEFCDIGGFDRSQGPQQCSTTWEVSGGSGEERIYAVLDPNDPDEMHGTGDAINNNIGYGLLYVANADYFDPGLRQVQPYQAILHKDAPGLGFGLYLPTENLTETVRYELVPTSIPDLDIVGSPIQVLAFHGGKEDPQQDHGFGHIPAGMMAFYRDEDLLPGMDEADLKLYRQQGSGWVEATCPGYDVVRFPEDNRLAVPICQTGTFVLSDHQPITQWDVHLPYISK